MNKKQRIVVTLVLVSLMLVALMPASALADDPVAWRGGRHHGRDGGWGRNEFLDAVAGPLGVTPRRLVRALGRGAELDDLARWQGMSPEELVEAYMGRARAHLQEHVHLGWMSEEQAHWLLEHMREQAQWAMGHGGGYLAFGWNGGGMMGYGWGYGGLIDAAAEVLGLSPWEIMAELHEGTTLRELAEERGVDPEEIIALFLSRAQERLDELVARGRLTPEQAEAILEELEEHARWFLDNSVMMGFGWGYGALLQAASEVLGISVEELVEELGQGKTLAQIAEEQGADPQAIVDAFVAPIRETLERAVEEGRLTQEQAEAILDRVIERAEWFLERPFPAGFGYGQHHGPGPGGHGGCW